MEQRITDIIGKMSRNYHELAKIIRAERQVAVHLAQLIDKIPDHPGFQNPLAITSHSSEVAENITSYLNNLADLEEAIAENLTLIIAELKEQEEE